jgi:hypothetical protein
MDERAVPILLLTPILMAIAGYFLAWRSKSAECRKVGNLIVAAVTGLVGLFASWWALGMTYGLLFDSHSEESSLTVGEFLFGLGAVGFILIWPVGALYLCVRFAKMALRKDQWNSTTNL